jgi:hypothetical protein
MLHFFPVYFCWKGILREYPKEKYWEGIRAKKKRFRGNTLIITPTSASFSFFFLWSLITPTPFHLLSVALTFPVINKRSVNHRCVLVALTLKKKRMDRKYQASSSLKPALCLPSFFWIFFFRDMRRLSLSLVFSGITKRLSMFRCLLVSLLFCSIAQKADFCNG